MDEIGLLDPLNEIHLFYVYKPYINYDMKLFIGAWSTHPMRIEQNRSPLQIWIEGIMNNATSGHTTTEELYSNIQFVSLYMYGHSLPHTVGQVLIV